MVNIIPAPVEVPIDVGFDPKIDILGRKPFGESLTRLVHALPDGGVIALDSAWGEGKSTFIKMWLGHLMQQAPNPIESIYFDAFEHDYSDDPFICISSELLAFFEKRKKRLEKFKSATLAVGKSIIKSTANILIKAGTLNAVDGTDLGQVGADISKAISSTADAQVWDRIDSHKKLKQSITSFREQLETEVRDHANGRLVFVIDELDRCRPDFSVAVVEQVKHLFAAKGVVFVLVLNSKQMQESVQGVYGQGIEAEHYLQKFINIWTSLPPKQKEPNHRTEYRVFIEHLVDKMDIRDQPDGLPAKYVEWLIQSLHELANSFNPSLRELERTVTYIAMALTALDPKILREPLSLAMLAMIKVLDSKLFDGLLHGEPAAKSGVRNHPRLSGDKYHIATMVYLTMDRKDLTEKLTNMAIDGDEDHGIYMGVINSFRDHNAEDGGFYLKTYTKAMSLFSPTSSL